jgi:hypothetical protein
MCNSRVKNTDVKIVKKYNTDCIKIYHDGYYLTANNIYYRN